MLPEVSGPPDVRVAADRPEAHDRQGVWPPGPAGEGVGQPPAGPPDSPRAGPSLDDAIEHALGAISEHCSPAALGEHVGALCEVLVAARASTVVTDATLEQLNRRLRQSG